MLKSKAVVPALSLVVGGALVAFVSGCPGTTGGGNQNQANAGNTSNTSNTTNGNNANNTNAANNNNAAGCPTGVVADGMTLFTGATCSGCHDESGVGGTVATGADVREFTTCEAVETRMNEVAVHSGFIGNLDDQDFADLAAFFDTLP